MDKAAKTAENSGNTAQKLLAMLGVLSYQLSSERGKNPSFTKKGPGRKHKQGR